MMLPRPDGRPLLQTGAPTYQAPAGGADAVLYQALDDERWHLGPLDRVADCSSSDVYLRSDTSDVQQLPMDHGSWGKTVAHSRSGSKRHSFLTYN